MATVSFSGSWIAKGVHETVWESLGDADEGAPQSPAGLPDKTIQFAGTWDGATAVLNGSNDGDNWFGLNQPDGTAISFTDDALVQVMENTKFIRPETSGGGGSTDVTARLVSRGE